MANLKIKLVKSLNGRLEKHIATAASLGLRKIGQVTIHDGDLIFGDVDGVLVVPKEIVEPVMEKALEKAAGEKLVRQAIEGGMSATDAFAKFGIL